MTKYIYPATFHKNIDDDSYTVIFNDLPGCITEGKDLDDALFMAQDALSLWIECNEDALPKPSDPTELCSDAGEFISLVSAEVRDNRAVRRTVSLPKWLDDAAVSAGVSLSRVLQEALKNRLQL